MKVGLKNNDVAKVHSHVYASVHKTTVNNFSPSDVKFATNKKVNIYLYAPNGSFLRYDLENDTEILIDNLEQDPMYKW